MKRTKTDDDSTSHGSCIASKATGAKNGVSKTTPLVIVKSSLNLVDIVWAFQKIVNSVATQKGRQVVVLLAATTKLPWRPPMLQDSRFNRLYLRMENLISLGAVVVVPVGSYGDRSYLADTVPAVFASPSKIPRRSPLPLIVVGAVDNKATPASWSQTMPVDRGDMIRAPGVKVACTKRGLSFRPTGTGTSFSAGMVRNRLPRIFSAMVSVDVCVQVAGLAAYFLGMKTPPFPVGGPDTSRNLQNYLRTSASWARPSGASKVVWNRLDGSLVPLSNASI